METKEAPKNPNDPSSAPKKRRRTWLWVLGWCFLFPVPVILLLKRSQMKTIAKVGIIIAAWIGWMCLFAAVVNIGNSRQQSMDSSAETVSNLELLTGLYPSLLNIEDCEVEEASVTEPEDFLILRLNEDDARIIAKNINGNHSTSQQLTEADIKALDLIVIAVTGSYSATYAPYVDGKRLEGTVTLHAEKAGLYCFDPGMEKVFDYSTVYTREFRQREESIQTEYTRLSNSKIIKAVDEKFHLKLGPFVRFGVWFTADLGFLLFVGLGVAAGFFFLIRGSWRSGLEKRRAAEQKQQQK